MNSDSGAIYNCRPSSPPEYASRFFVRGRKAQGYLWSNHYTISSPRRPCCIHLSVGSPLSRSASPCHFPSLSLSLSHFFPIYLSSNLCLLGFSVYSVPHPDALWAVTAACWREENRRFSIIRRGRREAVWFSRNSPSKIRTSLIFYHKWIEREREREMMPIKEGIRIGSHHCVCTDYVHMHRHTPCTCWNASWQDSGLDKS